MIPYVAKHTLYVPSVDMNYDEGMALDMVTGTSQLIRSSLSSCHCFIKLLEVYCKEKNM